MRLFIALGLSLFLCSCTTYREIKEVKLIGFQEDVSKGKSVGQFEADDCVFHVLGYWLGGSPDMSRAIANARTQKKSKVTDMVTDSKGDAEIRYMNNVNVSYDGFDAVVFGKRCIVVRGVGYR